MAYALTQDDIDRLGIPNAKAGDIANPADRALLGLEPDAETLSLQTPVSATAAAPQVASAPQVATAAAPMVNSQQDLAGLLNPVPKDPFESLSRGQRTMMGFAALKDAGFALQGKEGTAVRSVMEDITERADMERKRTAALAQQQVLSTLMGGPAVATEGGTGIDALKAQKQRLLSFAMMSPSSASAVALQVKSIDEQIAEFQQGEQSLISTNMGIAAVEALVNSPDLGKITGFAGKGNEWLAKMGRAPTYSSLMSYVEQLRGLNFLEAFETLKGGGQITEIEAEKATMARSRIDRALEGTPQDLILALEDVRGLFQLAREANPAYEGTGDGADATSQGGKTWNAETGRFE